ncbi:MAG: hypothetical protein H6673_04740 [Anaerolineales bacterium]|nr:hypothetical protein [Anaerolineales bacterium]
MAPITRRKFIFAGSLLAFAPSFLKLPSASALVESAALSNFQALWLAGNTDKANRLADQLLASSVMDETVLNTISEWHFSNTPAQPYAAVRLLLQKADQTTHLPVLHSACLIRAAQALAELGGKTEASRIYRAALEATSSGSATLNAYHKLALSGLHQLA